MRLVRHPYISLINTITAGNWMVNSLEQLLEFVTRLQTAKIHHRLDCVRNAIMVIIPTPSKYYEVEFFADGHIESQTFGPAGSVENPTLDEIAGAVIRDVNGSEIGESK
jgi:hypothetical protein